MRWLVFLLAIVAVAASVYLSVCVLGSDANERPLLICTDLLPGVAIETSIAARLPARMHSALILEFPA